MNLPLLSPAALDNAVYELIARELGVANAMRFIARHNQPDGSNYTLERKNWLPRDAIEVERLHDEPTTEFDRLVAGTRIKKERARLAGARSRKNGSRKKK